VLCEGFSLEVRDGLLTCLGYTGIGAMPPIPEGVEAIGDDAFAGRRLARLTLPATLRRIGRRAFQKCVLPREIVLPNRLEIIDVEAFYGCQSLESIRFGNGLRAIQARAFWYCIALRSVALPASLRLVGSRAFEGCDRLRHVGIHCPGAEFDEYVFNETPYWHRLLEIAELASPRRLGLTPDCPETLMLPEGHTHIDLYAFARSRIKYARLPGSLRTMGMCAFRDCKQLEEVSLSANTYCNYHLPLEPGEGIFSGCSSLHTVTLNGPLKNFTWSGSDVPELLKGFHPEKTFLGCVKLRRIVAWQVPLSAFPSQWINWALNGYLEDEDRAAHYAPSVAAEYDALLSKRRDWIVGRAIREGRRAIVQYLCERRVLSSSDCDAITERAMEASDAACAAMLLNYRHNILSHRDPLSDALDEL